MNKRSLLNRRVIVAAVSAVLMVGVVGQVSAQSAQQRTEERRARNAQGGEKAAAKTEEYPNATRQSPEAKATAKVTPKLQKMMKAYDDDKGAEAKAIAEEIIANPAANAYDRSFAAQIAAQTSYEADDIAGAMGYLQKAIDFNGLENNAHFGAMYMLAQLQLQEDQYDASLKTLDRFFAETKSTKPEQLVVKGNALYRLDRFPEAATVLKQAIDAAGPAAKPEWQQLLMASYAEAGNGAEAVKIAETVAAKTPNDKRAQLNLAAVYQQNDQLDKAAGVLEKLRASGQLTDDKEYRQLYATYLNMDGKEKQAISVINEGLEKGVLKPDYQVYVGLAQAYYYSDDFSKAIDAYKKAAPMAPDGETYLNLARLLWQEDRIPEAKEAAKQAVAKGVKKPDDAKKILALPAK